MTLSTILWILAGYIALSFLAYFIQDFFIFKPEKLSDDFQFKYDYPFEELNFTISDKERINGLRFFTEEKEKRGLVIYFHGNTRSIKGWAKYSRDFMAIPEVLKAGQNTPGTSLYMVTMS